MYVATSVHAHVTICYKIITCVASYIAIAKHCTYMLLTVSFRYVKSHPKRLGEE